MFHTLPSVERRSDAEGLEERPRRLICVVKYIVAARAVHGRGGARPRLAPAERPTMPRELSRGTDAISERICQASVAVTSVAVRLQHPVVDAAPVDSQFVCHRLKAAEPNVVVALIFYSSLSSS